MRCCYDQAVDACLTVTALRSVVRRADVRDDSNCDHAPGQSINYAILGVTGSGRAGAARGFRPVGWTDQRRERQPLYRDPDPGVGATAEQFAEDAQPQLPFDLSRHEVRQPAIARTQAARYLLQRL